MVDILLRRRQNNPILTGEPGVGKTAIVEGLALLIASGNCPDVLRDHRVLSLDMAAVIAGTCCGLFAAQYRARRRGRACRRRAAGVHDDP